MNTPLVQGRIVYCLDPIPDPQGRNPKEGRKLIVVSTPEQIERGDDLLLVAITSKLHGGEDEVELPYANPGQRSWTGLTEPSVALCSWTHTVPQQRVTTSKHFVPPKQLEQILRKVRGS